MLRRLTFGIFIVIAMFGALHAIFASTGDLSWFNLDGEYNAPAVFSALLLLAGGFALLINVNRKVVRTTALLLSGLLVFMSFDEILTIHERIEFITGIDWEALYAPIFLVAGVVALFQLRDIWEKRTPSGFFVAGSVCWAIAQVLEKLQWHGDAEARGYWLLMPIEELLEMSGSAFFLLAALHLLAEGQRRNALGPKVPAQVTG